MRFKSLFMIAAMFIGCVMVLSAKGDSNNINSTDGGYEIQVKANQLKDQTIFLGHYYMGKTYGLDSLVLNNNGAGSFKGDKKLKEGFYIMYFNEGKKFFDFILSDDQTFTVKIDTTDMPNKLEFKGADQTVAFYKYTKLLAEKQKALNDLNKIKKSKTDSAEIKALDAEIKMVSVAVKTVQDELRAMYKDGMVDVFLRGLIVPEVPEIETPADCKNVDSLKAVHKFGFYGNHYLDNIDFADVRSYYTPYIENQISTYLNKVLYQIADTVKPKALALIERSRGKDTLTFQIMTQYMLNYALKSKIMGMDNLMVDIARNYYFSGLATWADSTLMADLKKEVHKIERSLVGMNAHNIVLADSNGVYKPLKDMAGEQITVLYFFEPSCGHCKTTTPKVRDFYKKYKDDKRIKIIAVYMLEDKEEWQNYIKEQGLEDFTNVWDPERKSFYWYWYDTSSTPMMYLLKGSDLNIFAKRVAVETLDVVAEYELK